jgi:hypothetical protein
MLPKLPADVIAAARLAADRARAEWLAGCTDPDHPAAHYLADLAAQTAAGAIRRRYRRAARQAAA